MKDEDYVDDDRNIKREKRERQNEKDEKTNDEFYIITLHK